MILPCEMPQLDIPNVGSNHILSFVLVPVRKIISVQEIYSDSLFAQYLHTICASKRVQISFLCAEGYIIQARHPREIISLDLLERPKIFGRSNKSLQSESILVISDVYSKFHVPFLIKKGKSIEVVHALWSYIATYGPVKFMLSDNGDIFQSNILHNFLKKYNIRKLHSSPYISEARGISAHYFWHEQWLVLHAQSLIYH